MKKQFRRFLRKGTRISDFNIGFSFLTVLLGFFFVIGCSSEEKTAAESKRPTYVKKRKVSKPKETKSIRILTYFKREFDVIPRKGMLSDLERDTVIAFAEEQGLRPIFVAVKAYEDLIPSLLQKKGDIIAASMTVTEERKRRIAFSEPLALVKEQVITKANDNTIKKPADLAGRKVAVRKSSSYWKTVVELKERHPAIKIVAVPEYVDTEQILHEVAVGKYDVSVADSNLFEAISTYRADLKAACDLTGDRSVAWGIRPDARGLKDAINEFLKKSHVDLRGERLYKNDLPEIKKRKVLRVITRNNAATYFLWRGEIVGFEYDLLKHFAEKMDIRVDMVVPPSQKDLIPWLKQGKGDVVSAAMTLTEGRKKTKGVAFSRPYNYVTEMVVVRAEEEGIKGPQQLAGRTVVVRRTSSYWQSLEKLKKNGIQLGLVAAPEEFETEEVIDKVAKGEYDITVADSHILDIELTWRSDIRGAFSIGEEVAHCWVVRKENPRLLQELNEYIKREYRGLYYNITRNKYFKNTQEIQSLLRYRAKRADQISPYDKLIRKYATEYDFDWRLIAAQMYQESQFDPKARSWVGASGLLQVMPNTAKQLGFSDVTIPEQGIHAGVRYLDWVRNRFEPGLPSREKNRFALASYNAGYGHVMDARRTAEAVGLNPNRWFDNVEKGIMLLSRPEYAGKARYGYCRGRETVEYVRNIELNYAAYSQLMP
ncbi:MAG: transporter substrate-binding domain-containing protein [Thermodesulfobacteriota bacterium]|nr:transporter substrate-binding domain-containing protein [Thermodesulfobacteriota bacterium]